MGADTWRGLRPMESISWLEASRAVHQTTASQQKVALGSQAAKEGEPQLLFLAAPEPPWLHSQCRSLEMRPSAGPTAQRPPNSQKTAEGLGRNLDGVPLGRKGSPSELGGGAGKSRLRPSGNLQEPIFPRLSPFCPGKAGVSAPWVCPAHPGLPAPPSVLSTACHHRDPRLQAGAAGRPAGFGRAGGHSEVSTQEPWRCSGRWLWPRHPSCRCTMRTGK